MVDFNNILIICRDLKSLRGLLRFHPQTQSRYILASDDPRVHELAKEYSWIDEICWIEQMESFYNVADDVITIIRRINHWLNSLGRENDIPKDLLYWTMHCEGGDMSQRVMDLLLLIRSYQELIDRFQPKEIIVVQSPDSTWEDDLLFAMATEQRISIRHTGRLGLKCWLRKRVWLKWRPLVVGLCWTAKIIQVKLKNLTRERPKIDGTRSVMVQLVGDSQKHLNHTRPLLRALNEVGLQGICLGWNLGNSADILQRDGLAIIEMETWIGFRDIASGWIRIAKNWLRARKQAPRFLLNTESDKTKVLRSILWNSIQSFYFSELINRYCLKASADSFFRQYRLLAFCPFSLVLPVGVIACRVAIEQHPNCLVITLGGWPYNLPEPITDLESPIPRERVLFCSCGKLHREILIKKGFLKENVYITGLNWIEPISEFRNQYSKVDSREALHLMKDAELYVLYDPNSFLRGYLTKQERYRTLVAVLEFAKTHHTVEIIIKPHPNHIQGELEEIIEQYDLENVTLINSSSLPYHAINAADILITKFSTLVVEAMFLSVPSLGIVLDKEINFQLYEAAVDYHNDLQTLKTQLIRLATDSGYQERWFKQMKKRHSDFFSNHGLVSSERPAGSVSEIILSRIKPTVLPGKIL